MRRVRTSLQLSIPFFIVVLNVRLRLLIPEQHVRIITVRSLCVSAIRPKYVLHIIDCYIRLRLFERGGPAFLLV